MAKSNLAPISAAPSAGSKVREPDQFNGSDLRKLWSFLFQCQLNFHDHLAAFATDLAKVNYTVSFLRGMALDYFEPGLSAEREPAWLSDFPLFRSELETHFGPLLQVTIPTSRPDNSDPIIQHHTRYSDIQITIHIASMLFNHSILNPKSFWCSAH